MLVFKSHLVLEILASVLPKNPVIVEAGAFLGHTTIKMKHQWPQSIIHAFEPVPELFMQLQEKTNTSSNIFCYQYALSNTCSTSLFHKATKDSGAITQVGSLKKPISDAHNFIFAEDITVHTITLDTWQQKYNISAIDCLWFDMQGNELAALQGALHVLKAVRAIHVEVNFVPRYENQPLYPEVAAWLESHGFTAYARDFAEQKESFGNVIFVNK